MLAAFNARVVSAAVNNLRILQRGSDENTNGLSRQLMPKDADLSMASQEYLNNVADLMNARPRQTLGWKTPNQALEEEIAQFNSRVALAS